MFHKIHQRLGSVVLKIQIVGNLTFLFDAIVKFTTISLLLYFFYAVGWTETQNKLQIRHVNHVVWIFLYLMIKSFVRFFSAYLNKYYIYNKIYVKLIYLNKFTCVYWHLCKVVVSKDKHKKLTSYKTNQITPLKIKLKHFLNIIKLDFKTWQYFLKPLSTGKTSETINITLHTSEN